MGGASLWTWAKNLTRPFCNLTVRNGGEHLRKKKRNRDRRVVIPGDGDPCPRCGVPMQIREYAEASKEHLDQPYLYTRWFCCMNKSCRTTLVMPERYKVMNPEPH